MLTETQQRLYNHYLHALATAQNRGYKKRSNFDNITDEIVSFLNRLELFFYKHKNIRPYEFFCAGFKHLEQEFLPLDFFLTRKAIACWNKFSGTTLMISPDSEESLSSFKEGIFFIGNFLKANKQNLSAYQRMVNNHGVPFWFLHLKEQKISFYHLHAFGIVLDDSMNQFTELCIPNFKSKFEETYVSYVHSTKLKELGGKINRAIRK